MVAVDPAAFKATFGAPIVDLEQLVDLKTVTISRLMEICPVSLDVAPFYQWTWCAFAGLLLRAVNGV